VYATLDKTKFPFPGVRMATDPPAKKPRRALRIGKYEVLEHVASGGMGAVYRARDTDLQRIVALKVLPASLSANPAAIERFVREARAAARLRHENIVAIYDFGQVSGTFFIALEFVEGTDLDRHIKAHGKLDLAEARDIAVQATRALVHAHEQGLVHRDIKPSNFLITQKDGQLLVKMSDFGLARQDSTQEARVTRDGTTVGTVDYIAPEQARDSGLADARSDIYSLGCTLFHMLAGHPPFPEGGLAERIYKHCNTVAPNIRQFNAEVPASFAAIVARMLAKKPADRYQNAGELLIALQDADAPGVEMSTRDLLAGLAEGEAETTPARKKRPSPKAVVPKARPGSPKASPRRTTREEPDTASEMSATKVDAPPRRLPWIIGGAALALVLVVIAVIAMTARPPETTSVEAAGPPPLPVNPIPTGRAPDSSRSSTDPVIQKPILETPSWPALYQPATPIAKEQLLKEFLAPWANEAAPPADVPLYRVARLPRGGTAGKDFASLELACAAAPEGRLTIIEIHDDGPIFQPAIAVAKRSLIIRAAKGFRPQLIWDRDAVAARGDSFLTVSAGSLTLQGLDLMVRWSDSAAKSGFFVHVTDGDFQATDCSFSVSGKSTAGVSVVRLEKMVPAPMDSPVRCRLSHCYARGANLVALDLDAPGSEVLVDGCLLVGTEQPLLQVTERAQGATNLRVLRSTLVARQTLLRVRGEGVPELHWHGWDALLSRCGDDAGGEMVVLDKGIRLDHMSWHAVTCCYAGWGSLLSGGDKPIAGLGEWQARWHRTEGDASISARWPPVIQHDPGEAPAEDYRLSPVPMSPVGFAATSGTGPLGVDSTALPSPRRDWLALAFEGIPAPALDMPSSSAAPEIPKIADGRYHGGRVDLSKTELGAFLEEMQQKPGLGPRVVLHLSGSGEHKTRPVRVKGANLVLFFEPPEKSQPAAFLVPHQEKSVGEAEGLVQVEGGSLEIIGGEVRFLDFQLALSPPYLVKVQGGDLRMYRTRLTGPLVRPPNNYRGAIRYDPGIADAERPRGGVLNETVIVSGKAGIDASTGSKLRLKQSLLLCGTDAFVLQPAPESRPGGHLTLENVTVAARQGAFRLVESASPEPPAPFAVIARLSVFLNPFTDASPATLFVANDGALARSLLVWQGEGNVFDKRMGQLIAGIASGTLVRPPASEQPLPWNRLSGKDWERRQRFDVNFTRTFDWAKPDLEILAVPGAGKPLAGADLELLNLKKKPK
jgi:serine/threonine-protein kinase